ncbi:hypothetical protein [Yinghuangia sp. YIM S10712]|uniref:hypothetical protein n=1 Tax=Yinghuangia sp. YIM S10712 TaxID=3436930 RepID=UPI003F53CC42
MSALIERLPTLRHDVSADAPGPKRTRPYGLDAMTHAVPVDLSALPMVGLDPETQLSTVNGEVFLATDPAIVAGSSCNTESDGQTVISVDTDQNDD